MGFMLRHSHFRPLILALSLVLVFSSLSAGAQQNTSGRGRKYKAPPPTARIEVTVLRDVNGKPIENAAVIFHSMVGNKDEGNMELKTNEDGKAIIDVMPIGDTLRLQIIAKGFQTFGDDYKIDKDQMAIEIRMKRPGGQYSIYKDHPEKSEGGKDSDAGKPATPPVAPAPAPANKPAAQPDAQSSQPQPK
jgi:5-hydroxyisourate hydrolase-like protein (transthyretin family)